MSWMLTLSALLTVAANVSEPSSGRVFHKIEPTDVNSGKVRAVRMVRPVILKTPEIEFKLEALRVVNPVAPFTMSEPSICSMPSRARVPAAPAGIRISPVNVVQS